MKEDTKFKLVYGGISLFIFLFIVFFSQLTTEGNYINRPFSECEQNFTIDYGAFESCGRLMSDGTARIGIWSIFLGLPFLAFVVTPLLCKGIEKRRRNIKHRGKKK